LDIPLSSRRKAFSLKTRERKFPHLLNMKKEQLSSQNDECPAAIRSHERKTHRKN